MGAGAASAFAVGAGELFPRHPFVFVVGYVFVVEQVPPFPAVKNLSLYYYLHAISGVPELSAMRWGHSLTDLTPPGLGARRPQP